MKNRGLAIKLLMVLLVVYAGISTARIISNTFAPTVGTDFHSYWYYGHFLRQGLDPYQAFFRGSEPSVPVHYLDGYTTKSLPIAQPGLGALPANTAPMVLLLHLFSYLSWPLAKLLWMTFNLILMLITPWLAMRLLPTRLGFQLAVMVALSFYGLLATRNAVSNGQTTILVFALMLFTLLLVYNGYVLLPGIALGLAMSKYSLAFPLLLLLIYKRKWFVIGTGLLVQLLGLVGLAVLGHSSPLSVISTYIVIFRMHTIQTGIHLGSLLPHYTVPITGILVTGTFFLFVLLWRWVLRDSLASLPSRVRDLCLLTVLSLWTLLIVYHGIYDSVLVLLPLVLIVSALNSPDMWRLHPLQSGWLARLLILSIVVLSLPGNFIGRAIAGWNMLIRAATTIILLLLLILTLWLWYQIRHGFSTLSSKTHVLDSV